MLILCATMAAAALQQHDIGYNVLWDIVANIRDYRFRAFLSGAAAVGQCGGHRLGRVSPVRRPERERGHSRSTPQHRDVGLYLRWHDRRRDWAADRRGALHDLWHPRYRADVL